MTSNPRRQGLIGLFAIGCLAILSLRACKSGEDAASQVAVSNDAGDAKAIDSAKDATLEDDGVASDTDPSWDAQLDSDVWQPAGDPGWKALDWAPGCDTQVATAPSNAAPILAWADCGVDYPGCRRLLPNWPNISGVPLYKAQLFKDGAMLRLGLNMWFVKEWRKGIFDENGAPVAAWRGTAQHCGSTVAQWTQKHICVPLGSGKTPTFQGFLPTSDPSGPPLHAYSTDAMISDKCNEELFIGFNNAGRAFIRDLSTGEAFWPEFPGALDATVNPIGGAAFVMLDAVGSNGEIMTGWSWKRPNVIQQIVYPGSEMVYDIRSDGTTLVWVQTTSKSIFDRAPGWIWTSPSSTEPGEIVPTRRRETPYTAAAGEYKAVGGGYYALVELPLGSKSRFLHIYRLTDMRHWKVPTPADVKPAEVILIDQEEVWFVGTTTNDARSTVIRQRLDQLGGGD
jgi:hypothetical protein